MESYRLISTTKFVFNLYFYHSIFSSNTKNVFFRIRQKELEKKRKIQIYLSAVSIGEMGGLRHIDFFVVSYHFRVL